MAVCTAAITSPAPSIVKPRIRSLRASRVQSYDGTANVSMKAANQNNNELTMRRIQDAYRSRLAWVGQGQAAAVDGPERSVRSRPHVDELRIIEPRFAVSRRHFSNLTIKIGRRK